MAGISAEAIVGADRRLGLGRVRPHAVEHQVHDAEAGGVRDEFPAPHEAPLQVLLLIAAPPEPTDAPGLKSVDPYDLIVVIAGVSFLPVLREVWKVRRAGKRAQLVKSVLTA